MECKDEVLLAGGDPPLQQPANVRSVIQDLPFCWQRYSQSQVLEQSSAATLQRQHLNTEACGTCAEVSGNQQRRPLGLVTHF